MSSQHLSGDVRIERPATAPTGSCTDSTTAGAIPGESRSSLRRRMGSAVVEGCDLDVLDVTATVRPLVFKAQIRKVDVPVEERQIMLVRPLLDLSRIPVRTPISVGPLAVPIVEK